MSNTVTSSLSTSVTFTEDSDTNSEQTFDFSNLFYEELQTDFKMAFGPNWLFHIEQELKFRYPKYAFINESPESQQAGKIEELTKLILPLKETLIFGDDIKNPVVKNTLYIWNPTLRITHLIEEHPDWEIHSEHIHGGVRIVGVGEIRVVRDTYEMRLALWNDAVAKLNENLTTSSRGHLCSDCFADYMKTKYYEPPSPPKLTRQSGVYLTRSEQYPVFCRRCQKPDITTIQF